jgi:hypothetical protein
MLIKYQVKNKQSKYTYRLKRLSWPYSTYDDDPSPADKFPPDLFNATIELHDAVDLA